MKFHHALILIASACISWSPFVLASWVFPWQYVFLGRSLTLTGFMTLHYRGHQSPSDTDSWLVRWFRSVHDIHHVKPYWSNPPDLVGMTTDTQGFVTSWMATYLTVFLVYMTLPSRWGLDLFSLCAIAFGGLLDLFLQGNAHYLHHWSPIKPYLPNVLRRHHSLHHTRKHVNLHAFDLSIDWFFGTLVW